MLRRIRRLFRKSRAENELDCELRFHIEKQIADNIAAGMPAAEARRRARLEFGGIEGVKEEVRDTRWETYFDNLFRDFGYAARTLRKDRRFSLVAILALALGIGASTTVFSVVSAALLRPLPYGDPSRLVWADEFMRRLNDWIVPDPEFTNWSTGNHTFEAMAAYDGGRRINLTGAGEPERIESACVTAKFLTVLGIEPALGRAFLADEDRPGGPLAVLLTDSLWRRKFGGNREIFGKSIDLDGQGRAVVGVLPATFRFPDKGIAPECLLAFQLPAHVDWSARNMSLTRVMGRLAPGVSVAQARADLATLAEQSKPEVPPQFLRMREGLLVEVIPLHQKIAGDVRPALLVLLTAVIFILLMACVNVANLQLARTAGRQRELAVRTAIGASRGRLIQQLIAEGACLAAMGGAVGLLLTEIGVRLLRDSLPATIAQIGEVIIDRPVLLFTLGVTCLTVVLFGVVPAFRASQPDVNANLKEGDSRIAGVSIHRDHRGALVALEFALAFILLVGSGLLVRGFVRLSNVAPGFDPSNVLTASTDLPRSRYSTDQQRRDFFFPIMARVRGLPGVQSIGLTTQLPFGSRWGTASFFVEGQPEPAGDILPPVSIAEVSSDYFQTMLIPLRTGRSFTSSDLAPDSRVIVVSTALAQRFLPAGAPFSKRVRLGSSESPWSTVVGVVGDVHYGGLEHPADPQVYVPYSGHGDVTHVVIRSDHDPRSLASAVRGQFAAVDSSQPVFGITTMQQRVDDSIKSPRFNMTLLTIFAVLAVLLAMVGILGVISYSVSQRTHEIGIRMALGAAPSDVLRLVLGQGMFMIVMGLAFGLAGSLLLTRFLASLLYAVRPTDPLTIVSAAVLLVLVALGACYVPARRAARLDPLVALRHE